MKKNEKNERTSKRVASIAGRILEIFREYELPASAEVYVSACGEKIGTVGDIRALAASALTQAPAKKAVRR